MNFRKWGLHGFHEFPKMRTTWNMEHEMKTTKLAVFLSQYSVPTMFTNFRKWGLHMICNPHFWKFTTFYQYVLKIHVFEGEINQLQDGNNEVLHLEICNLWDLQKKMVQIAHFWPPGWLIQSAPPHRGSPLPTRQLMQRLNEQQQRMSSWAINYIVNIVSGNFSVLSPFGQAQVTFFFKM